MRDAVYLENRGVPTITLSGLEFEQAAKTMSKAMGVENLPLLLMPAAKDGVLPDGEEFAHIVDENESLINDALRQKEEPVPAQ